MLIGNVLCVADPRCEQIAAEHPACRGAGWLLQLAVRAYSPEKDGDTVWGIAIVQEPASLGPGLAYDPSFPPADPNLKWEIPTRVSSYDPFCSLTLLLTLLTSSMSILLHRAG